MYNCRGDSQVVTSATRLEQEYMSEAAIADVLSVKLELARQQGENPVSTLTNVRYKTR